MLPAGGAESAGGGMRADASANITLRAIDAAAKMAIILEQCLYRNVMPLLRQPVLRLGYCGTPFIGAVSGFLR
jgi:hypothetical protein